MKIAEAIVDASNWLKNNGHKTAAFQKLAGLDDLSKLAHQHTMDLMQKAAEGSTIEGGDKGNKETDAVAAETKMDVAQRPSGYAENSLGKTDVDTRPGAIGKEQEHPNKPSESPSGDNSVKDQSRTASLAAFLKKTAEGSTIMGGDKGNKEPTTGEGKMDASMRPEGYAMLPSQGALGELMQHFDAQSAIGKEQPHPNAPAQSPSGSNSLIETSQKSAEEQAFITVFKKTAQEVMQYIPGSLSEDAKVAHVRACMGMTTEMKAQYLQGLQKEAADKTAAAAPQSTGTGRNRAGAYDGREAYQRSKEAEMPDFIREKIEAKKEDGGEKKDDDKKDSNPFAKKDDEKKDDEKKDDEKKEGSLAARLRRIAAAVRTS